MPPTQKVIFFGRLHLSVAVDTLVFHICRRESRVKLKNWWREKKRLKSREQWGKQIRWKESGGRGGIKWQCHVLISMLSNIFLFFFYLVL